MNLKGSFTTAKINDKRQSIACHSSVERWKGGGGGGGGHISDMKLETTFCQHRAKKDPDLFLAT